MHLCVNTQKHPQNDIFACVWLIYRMMKSPTTTQRTMWVGFFLLPFCSPPIYAAANTKVKLGHGPVIWYRWPSVPCPPVHLLSLPPLFHFSSSIQHIHALFIPLSVYIIASAFYCSPSLLCLFSRLFIPCSFLSVIPLPTLSQVKRFQPCSALIDRWDVWAGYTAALLGSNCSHTLSLPPHAFSSLPPSISLPHPLSTVHFFLHIS